jgi:hypothetical protein
MVASNLALVRGTLKSGGRKRMGNLVMTPEVALGRQIECYRRMTGEERLKIALDLHALSCDMAREGIRQQHPEADEAEVERRLRQRLEAAHR